MGEIQSIGKRRFGEEWEATCAEIYFERDDLVMILPKKDLDKRFRRLVNTKEARRILAELEQWDGSADKQWKARAQSNQAAIDRGDPFEYAKVFKSLSKLEAEGDLRPRDRAHLNESLELLAQELSKSLGKTPEQARNLISKVGKVPLP